MNKHDYKYNEESFDELWEEYINRGQDYAEFDMFLIDEIKRLRGVLWTCDVHPTVIKPPKSIRNIKF